MNLNPTKKHSVEVDTDWFYVFGDGHGLPPDPIIAKVVTYSRLLSNISFMKLKTENQHDDQRTNAAAI